MIGLVLVDPAHTPFICYLLVCQIASSQLEAQGTQVQRMAFTGGS